MAEKDKYKPIWKVSPLKIARSGNRFTATWKVPSAALKNDADNRFTDLQIRWSLDFDGKKKDIVDVDATTNERATSNSQTYGEFTGNWGNWKKKPLSRSAFYPFSGGKKLDSIGVKVRGRRNYSSKYHNGPWTKEAEYKFYPPRKPSISIEYNESTRVISYTIKTDPGNDNYERYDTRYRVYVKRQGRKDLTVKSWQSSTATSISDTYDMDNAGIVWSSGTAAWFTVEAYSRGINGDSKDHAEKQYRVEWPDRPTINSISAAKAGRVQISVNVNSKNVDSVVLQRQRNLSPGTDPDGELWSDVANTENNGVVPYLYDLIGDAKSTDGLYTWYRVKAGGSGFTAYSEPMRADALFSSSQTATNDDVSILSVTPLKNGTSLKVVIGYNEDNRNTGTEVSWSTDPNAWKSAVQPKKFDFEWVDSPAVTGYAKTSDTAVVAGKTYYTRSGSGTTEDPYVYTAVQNPQTASIGTYYVKYTKSATVIIPELEDGKTYYISARRYLEGEDATTYTGYAPIVEEKPAEQPTSVTLVGPSSFVVRGEAIELTWTFDGSATQVGYDVHPSNNPKIGLAHGDDALGAATIPAEVYGDADSLNVVVTVRTGGDPIDSNAVTVGIADPPQIEIGVPATATAQPVGFEAYSAENTATLYCKCHLSGDSNIPEERPDGTHEQFPNDVVWADAVSPAWSQTTWSETVLRAQLSDAVDDAQDAYDEAADALSELQEGDEGYEEAVIAVANASAALSDAQAALAAHPSNGTVYMAEMQMADGIWLIDGAQYDVEATPTDNDTGLSGASQSAGFAVSWSHQAPAPSDGITVAVDSGSKVAVIALAAPNNAGEYDVYDLYRGTSDGFQLIRADLKLDSTVTDRYPAFGEQSYCVCLRTRDGDMDWKQYAYTLASDTTRFDWPSGNAEVKYNLAYSEQVAKRFEAREHLDGGTGGYYNAGVNKTGSYTAVMIDGYDDFGAMNDMASYPGACFCRTPDGKAFQCNVDTSVSTSGASPIGGMSFDITRMDLTSDYMVSAADIVEGQNA